MKHALLTIFVLLPLTLFAQIPKWYTDSFKQQRLELRFELAAFIKPAFQQADFNGDGIMDVAALVVEKRSKKRGIVLIEGRTKHFFVFGAGTIVGVPKEDGSDDLSWMKRWRLYKSKIAYETKFDKDDNIVGSVKRNLRHLGLEIWALEDGEEIAGGIIYWDGKKFAWIHEGE